MYEPFYQKCTVQNFFLSCVFTQIVDLTGCLNHSSKRSFDAFCQHRIHVLFWSIVIIVFCHDNSRWLLTLYTPNQNSCASSFLKISRLHPPAAENCTNHSQCDGSMPLGAAKNISSALKFRIAVYDFRKYSSGEVIFY